MTSVVVLRPERRLPDFVTVYGGLTVDDITRETWDAIDVFAAALDRVRRLLAFIEARVAEVTDQAAQRALQNVLTGSADSTSCTGGVLYVLPCADQVELHWPGDFASHCDGCGPAEAAEDTLRAMAAAWSDHADYGAAVSS